MGKDFARIWSSPTFTTLTCNDLSPSLLAAWQAATELSPEISSKQGNQNHIPIRECPQEGHKLLILSVWSSFQSHTPLHQVYAWTKGTANCLGCLCVFTFCLDLTLLPTEGLNLPNYFTVPKSPVNYTIYFKWFISINHV